VVDLQGAAQKGPFILGSSVTISPLKADGAPTGQQFAVQTVGGLGEYSIAGIPAGPVALVASGFYFDEVRGVLSDAPLTLRATQQVVDAETTAHIHVLTHLVELRAGVLRQQGTELAAALAQAEAEAVAALEVGVPGFTLTGAASQALATGADTDDNAYVFALSAVLARAAAIADPDAVEAELQMLLNALAADLADDAVLSPARRAQLAAAETALAADTVRKALADHLLSLGLPAATPNYHRVLDQDHDGLANADDNCPFTANPDQADADLDGTGDACDGCLEGAKDQDGDGYADACDNCPAVANPVPPQELPWNNQMGAVSDWDEDGLGNVCDDCPNSKGTGAVKGENCCDPRTSKCSKMYAGSLITFRCHPFPNGGRFGCDSGSCDFGYRQSCLGCIGPCVPAGALQPAQNCAPGSSCDCSKWSCVTQYCTVGDNAPCMDSNVCIPWFKPGTAPAGLEKLGICASKDQGACVGKAGIECVKWTNVTLK